MSEEPGTSVTPAASAEGVRQAVLACPVVARMAEEGVATFLPGRRVTGVRFEDDGCEVAVVLRLDGRPLPELAEQVRDAARAAAGGRPVDVLVADVLTPDEAAAEAAAEADLPPP